MNKPSMLYNRDARHVFAWKLITYKALSSLYLTLKFSYGEIGVYCMLIIYFVFTYIYFYINKIKSLFFNQAHWLCFLFLFYILILKYNVKTSCHYTLLLKIANCLMKENVQTVNKKQGVPKRILKFTKLCH